MRRPLLLPLLLSLPAAGAAAQADTARDTTAVLEPIVVTVARTPGALRTVPAGTSVRRGADIALGRPGLSLSEVLGTVPGVTIQNRFNESRDNAVAIRGFGARAAFGIRGVRILLDGIPQTLPDGQGQLTSVDPAQLERIEVLRGGASALHGNASGGVISLWTRAAPVSAVTPWARLVAGGHGTRAAHAGVAAPLGRGEVSLQAARIQTDGFRAQSAAETWRAGLRGAMPIGTSTDLVARLDVSDQPRLQDPGSLTAAELAADPTRANPAFVAVGAGKDLSQVLGGLTVRHTFPGHAQLEVTGYGIRRDLVNTLPFAVIDIARWAYGTRTQLTVPLPDLPALPVVTLGADAQWQRDDRVHTDPGDGTVTRDQLERVREVGPFAQVRLAPVSRVSLTLGARLDHVRFAVDDRQPADGDESGERTMAEPSWTVGIATDLHALAAPYASVGTSFETPTTTELANRPDGSDGFNPALAPQTALHWEAGIRGALARFRYAAAAFRADIEDALIAFEVPGQPGRAFYRNAGAARHQGVEVEAAVRPVRGVEVGLAWTEADYVFTDFATADDIYDGNAIPGVPARFVSGTLRAEAAGIWFFAETRASSGIPVDDANSARTDPWWTADLRLGYRLRFGPQEVDVWLGLENAFDETYVSAVAVNASFGRFYEPGRPRTFLVGARLR